VCGYEQDVGCYNASLINLGSRKNRAKLRNDIEEYLTAYAIDFDNADIDTFIALRPNGLAFDMEEKFCVFLEYTRAMDTNED